MSDHLATRMPENSHDGFLLLLGTGGSGKSTLLKQLRLMHDMPFSGGEIEDFRQLVYDTLMLWLQCLLEELPGMNLELPQDYDAHLIISAPEQRPGEPFQLKYLSAALQLWEEPVVKEAWSRRNEVSLPENLAYFISTIPRLLQKDFNYVPTEQDILHTYTRTVGISQTAFHVKGKPLQVIDVGGVKSERRKWAHCFQYCTTIFFMASLSGYDQGLVEDRDMNEMQDSMQVWNAICQTRFFKHITIILFLNKDDLFQEKIKTSPIQDYFPDFDGAEADVMAGRQYFKERFMKLANDAVTMNDKEIYMHITTATNTDQMHQVLAKVEGVSLSTM
ncbi:heterotrimeric G protein alpha subunit 4 [Mycena amicta]|nr:heterotrimeric G protein alpha subunit 4 [Mycena amicta]